EACPDQNARILVRASRFAAGWALLYASYRLYYAAGGTVGMLGTPVSDQQWRMINAVGAAFILIVAGLPLVLLKAWRRRRAQPALLALSWLIAVGSMSHAFIGIIQRISSLTGALTIPYPFWQTIDRTEADLQALFFNEPWFLVLGLLWAIIAWAGALRASPRRKWWFGSVIAAVAGLTAVGVLSAYGTIGSFFIG
ncbi:MAG TPA: hypothetical protein VK933_08860, partial [Longimicrobiales bacterium]|nr:hypothetical protein [Longimicrobiales bacterium]